MQNLQAVSDASRGQYYVYGLAGLIVLGVVSYVYQTLTSPLRSVPGPFLARFTRLWELHAVLTGENTKFNMALHKKYGTRAFKYI